jgi:hypothetical protein
MPFFVVLFLGKHILADTAQRAYPILGNVLPAGTRRNAVVRIAHSLVIDISADFANVFHFLHLPQEII